MTKPSLLIVSAEPQKLNLTDGVFTRIESVVVDEFPAMLKILKKRRFDICFIHMNLSRKTEFFLLKQMQKIDGSLDILISLEQNRIQTVMETLGNHWDYLVIPYSSNELKLKLEKMLRLRSLERENYFWRVELAALLADQRSLTLEDIPTEIWEKAGETKTKEEGQTFKRSRGEFERECLRRALERAEGRQTQAAKALGIHRNTLIWKLKKLNLEKEYQKMVRKRRGHS